MITDARTDSPKTECLRLPFSGGGSTKMPVMSRRAKAVSLLFCYRPILILYVKVSK